MNPIELKKYGFVEYCELDISSGMKIFSKTKKIAGFTGLYYMDETNFFAIYPTRSGPYVYYQGKQYPIHKKILITLNKDEYNRKFVIRDYNIEINYMASQYIGFDVWSDEIDLDLFYMIEQSYKSDSFYEQYTV